MQIILIMIGKILFHSFLGKSKRISMRKSTNYVYISIQRQIKLLKLAMKSV